MIICAVETSGPVAGVALVEDSITVAEYNIQYGITHSQTLMPMLDQVKRITGFDMNDIDAYAVAAGPGSFTGLRIGIATVKGLAMAADKPVVAVPTLESLAYNAFASSYDVCPIMDARRSQVYTGIYHFDRDGQKTVMKVRTGQRAMAFEELCSVLNESGHDVMFVGDGIPVFADRISELLTRGYILAPPHMNRQRAASLGALAYEYMTGHADGLEGCVTDADGLEPVYLRMSQAERVKKERESEA